MPSGASFHPALTIAVPTFRRAERLRRLLPVLAAHLEECRTSGLLSGGGIVVVDNDPDRSAETTVAECDVAGVRYVGQPTPGIPAVRNAALDAVSTRLLVFIDDDESPRPGWLRALVETWRDHGAPTGVTGRVVSEFPPDTDPWVLASGLFQRPQMPTGTPRPVVATGNLLLDLDAVRAMGVRFDESIGLGGGSDTMFSTMLSRRGARFVWCDESVADDPVEASRLTREWALRRAFSHGNVIARVALSEVESRSQRVWVRTRLMVEGAARFAVGHARAAVGRVAGRLPMQARGERLARRGAGMVSGSLGHAFHAYAHDRATAAVG